MKEQTRRKIWTIAGISLGAFTIIAGALSGISQVFSISFPLGLFVAILSLLYWYL